MKTYEFTVVIERDEDGRFVAIVPALQGCYTEGETEQEARDLIEDAIRLHRAAGLMGRDPGQEQMLDAHVLVAEAFHLVLGLREELRQTLRTIGKPSCSVTQTRSPRLPGSSRAAS